MKRILIGIKVLDKTSGMFRSCNQAFNHFLPPLVLALYPKIIIPSAECMT